MDASETCPRRLNAKEVLITQKGWRICISCGRWFSKIIRKRLRSPRTHSEMGIHCKERISAENLKAIGKKLKMTQKVGKTSGQFNEVSFIVIKLNREFNYTCQKKRSFPISTKRKESPLRCIDEHSPHPKVRVHPGEC